MYGVNFYKGENTDMRKWMIRAASVLLCLVTSLSCFSIFASAEKITYSKGAADVSDAYKQVQYLPTKCYAAAAHIVQEVRQRYSCHRHAV